MHVWTEIKRVGSKADYEKTRATDLCCSVSFYKKDYDVCLVCGGDHPRVERRLRCSSMTCSPLPMVCQVLWKVQHCTARDEWVVLVNDKPHARGAVPCQVDHASRMTDEIRDFIREQDENDATPLLIETRLKNHGTMKRPPHGWPSLEQIKNALKRIREEEGTRNTFEGILEAVMKRMFTAALESSHEKGFVFAPRVDGNGVPLIASGHDNDPFILGVTSLRLLENALRYSRQARFAIFHADATFKLSDVAYPVITCGYTDVARSYQLVALFVVSQRTQRDFRMCFSALSDLCFRLRGERLRSDATMGDADDAQYLGFKDVPSFAPSTPLMCYFHVLYNVRKRTAHLHLNLRVMIMRSIDNMHYTSSIEEFQAVCTEELERWLGFSQLKVFTHYFAKEWLSGRFWRWQIFHTPPAYATTNNPCEVYNSTIKSYTRRKRFHMAKLLTKMCDLVESFTPAAPVADGYCPEATADVLAAAERMISSGRTTLHQTIGSSAIRVKYVRAAEETDETEEADEFVSTFDAGCDLPEKLAYGQNTVAKEEEEKARAAMMYVRACSWSLWRAHIVGMPHDGWLVDYENPNCGCRYFKKFLVCAHLLIAQSRHDLPRLGKKRMIHDRSRKSKKPTKKSKSSAVASSTAPSASSTAASGPSPDIQVDAVSVRQQVEAILPWATSRHSAAEIHDTNRPNSPIVSTGQGAATDHEIPQEPGGLAMSASSQQLHQHPLPSSHHDIQRNQQIQQSHQQIHLRGQQEHEWQQGQYNQQQLPVGQIQFQHEQRQRHHQHQPQHQPQHIIQQIEFLQRQLHHQLHGSNLQSHHQPLYQHLDPLALQFEHQRQTLQTPFDYNQLRQSQSDPHLPSPSPRTQLLDSTPHDGRVSQHDSLGQWDWDRIYRPQHQLSESTPSIPVTLAQQVPSRRGRYPLASSALQFD